MIESSTLQRESTDEPLPRQNRLVAAATWCLYAFASLSVFTGLVPLIPTDIWWIRLGDFPRVQLLVTHVLFAVLLLFLLRSTIAKSLLALLALCIAIQLYWISPYLPIAPKEVETAKHNDAESRITILAANVLQKNREADSLLRLIDESSPDIVAVCEVNDRWINDLKSLNSEYSGHIAEPRENGYGIALWSRLPIIDATVRHMVVDEIPSLDVTLKLETGQAVRLFVVHPHPPMPFVDTTERDAELVLVGRELQGVQPAIVTGDINDVAWSRTTNLFQEVSGLLDPRKGRGLYPTYRADSWIVRYPLDYLFHSDDFRVVRLETLSSIGSDHLPLFVELSYEPEAIDTQSGPQLDAGDVEDAENAIESAREKKSVID